MIFWWLRTLYQGLVHLGLSMLYLDFQNKVHMYSKSSPPSPTLAPQLKRHILSSSHDVWCSCCACKLYLMILLSSCTRNGHGNFLISGNSHNSAPLPTHHHPIKFLSAKEKNGGKSSVMKTCQYFFFFFFTGWKSWIFILLWHETEENPWALTSLGKNWCNGRILLPRPALSKFWRQSLCCPHPCTLWMLQLFRSSHFIYLFCGEGNNFIFHKMHSILIFFVVDYFRGSNTGGLDLSFSLVSSSVCVSA